MKEKFGLKISIGFLLVFLAGLFCVTRPPAIAQQQGYAYRIVPYASLPATCNPLNGEIAALVSGAGSVGLYHCQATNTWISVGTISNQFLLNQGILTVSKPYVQQTATWNNAGVTFTGFSSNITTTAMAANSRLLTLQENGLDAFFIVATPTAARIDDAGSYGFNTRSQIQSHADGHFDLLNNAGTGATDIHLGPNTVAFPSLQVAPAVAGQSQGILILRGDDTPQVFGNLGAATNGAMIYCSDCTFANPCAGGGTGAIAKRLNGAWRCD